MSSKTKDQKRARQIQRDTGWPYTECLRLSRGNISDDALRLLVSMRAGQKGDW